MPILKTPLGMRDSNDHDTAIFMAKYNLEWESCDAAASMSIIDASKAIGIRYN